MVNVKIITDVQGEEPDILSPIKHEELVILVSWVDERVRQPAPESGWTHELLQATFDEFCADLPSHEGVLGIFRPKTTKNAEAPAPQSLQEGITFS